MTSKDLFVQAEFSAGVAMLHCCNRRCAAWSVGTLYCKLPATSESHDCPASGFRISHEGEKGLHGARVYVLYTCIFTASYTASRYTCKCTVHVYMYCQLHGFAVHVYMYCTRVYVLYTCISTVSCTASRHTCICNVHVYMYCQLHGFVVHVHMYCTRA